MHDLLNSLQEVLGDRYQLEAELGRGGMATVYRARDAKYDREVAIKVLPPDMSSLLGRERFVREIAIAANLQHPHIVPLYDSGGDGDVLYYVMPLIAGESLRDRLDRETQLPVDEALAITRDVAEGLGHAHARGVVHRDIKPENILLSAGRAMVADFGIARAIADIEAERLTSAGIIPGTPPYMSPEQAGGSYLIDGRADLYALGCVLYEMLAGSPPFTGKTAQVILARHLHEKPPSIHVARPTVSPGVQQVLEQLLAKVPADRYPTASRFVTALDTASAVKALGTARPGWRSWTGVAGVAAVLVTLVWALVDRLPVGVGSGVAPDTSRYVVLPFEHGASVPSDLGAGELLHDALGRWSGIGLVDLFQVRDAISRRRGNPLDTRSAAALAVRLGAGRFVRGDVTRLGDTLRVHASLFDAVGFRPLAEHTVKLPVSLDGSDSAVARLADSLLFRGAGPGLRAESRTGTNSFPARQAYVRGHAAIERWDLLAADSSFAAATTFDPLYAQAFLWLAQVRNWSGAPAASWKSAAERAATGRNRLDTRDQVLSDALLMLSRGDAEAACRLWRELAHRNPYDFASWFGLGNCLIRDEAVVRDRASPSSWRFRSSYQEAIDAYEHAYSLLPSMLGSLKGRSYESVRRLLKTSPRAMRRGRAVAPDTLSFAAHAIWQGDTLAFVPYPRQVLADRGALWATPQALDLAMRRQRERFRQIALAWIAAYPQSPDALEALAISMEMVGDPAALDSLQRARALATAPADRARIGAAEVWLRVRRAAPSDVGTLETARALADSLLSAYPASGAPEPLLLASLAALLGRANQAAAYSREPAVSAEFTPLARLGYPLLSFAALGGPADSLRVLEAQVDSATRTVQSAQQRGERAIWLARPATLSLPAYAFHSMAALVGSGDFLLDAQAQFLLRRDSRLADSVFTELVAVRRFTPPTDITVDALFPEAQLLAEMGQANRAIAWLDPTLTALGRTEPTAFAEPAMAGALVRAMVLRADLADRVGDRPTATTWARAVLVLWSSPDPFLAPVVRRMRRLAT